MNLRPSGYEPDELPGCSTPRRLACPWRVGRCSGVSVFREEGCFEGVSRVSAFGRPGGDLLSRVLRQSTMGAEAVDGRVRDGIGSGRLARATRPAKRRFSWVFWIGWRALAALIAGAMTLRAGSHNRLAAIDAAGMDNGSDQAGRAISTGQLHALLRFHIRPINVVVFHGSSGRSRFEVGFPLRCLQRLSRPHIATLHCGWRHNRSTRGVFVPVLSY